MRRCPWRIRMAGDPDEGRRFLSQREIENLPVSLQWGGAPPHLGRLEVDRDRVPALGALRPGMGLALVDGIKVVMESSW